MTIISKSKNEKYLYIILIFQVLTALVEESKI